MNTESYLRRAHLMVECLYQNCLLLRSSASAELSVHRLPKLERCGGIVTSLAEGKTVLLGGTYWVAV